MLLKLGFKGVGSYNKLAHTPLADYSNRITTYFNLVKYLCNHPVRSCAKVVALTCYKLRYCL